MPQHEVLLPQRRAELDASWAIAVQWGRKHEWGQSNNLFWPFFDEVIRQRLPADASAINGPVKLRPIDPGLAWFGDPTTWKATAVIAASQRYSGPKTAACWFPGPQTAHAWQAFVVEKPLLRITSPWPQGDKRPLPIFDSHQKIPIQIETDATTPIGKIRLYDGDNFVTDGDVKNLKTTLEIGPLVPGIHTLIARADSSENMVYLSRPVVILVNPNAN